MSEEPNENPDILRKFKCEGCGNTFYTDKSIEEVDRECEQLYGEKVPSEELASVCTDCYEVFLSAS